MYICIYIYIYIYDHIYIYTHPNYIPLYPNKYCIPRHTHTHTHTHVSTLQAIPGQNANRPTSVCSSPTASPVLGRTGWQEPAPGLKTIIWEG